MGGGKKTRNSAVATEDREGKVPSLAHSPSDSECAKDGLGQSGGTADPTGYVRLHRRLQKIAEELDKRLSPIMEGMVDLTACTEATETKMAEAMEAVQAHGREQQDLGEQLCSLENTNEDLNNRTRRNNIRVRGIPESVSTELLTDTLTVVYQNLLPESSTADLLIPRWVGGVLRDKGDRSVERQVPHSSTCTQDRGTPMPP
ncbi:Hypothetical predicted protein [Pelobates cultripes]|uniref:Uncharacterized protein n=1 Tax=Pelobates cultripes TaxID=61616 RepID=A0AAD1TDP5_PELCU|nr:Hypothetical predicted protein [Pelobates cultripes]